MAAFHFVTLSILLFFLCTPVSNLQQLECKNGFLDIFIKNSAKPLLKINCNLKPVVAVINEDTSEECHGKGDKKFKIVSRTEWKASTENIPSDILPATDCVIADGSSYIITGTDYLAKMKEDQEYQIKEFGSLFNNFHIGDNGVIYEGLGWDKIYFLRSGGLNCLRIAFTKPTRDDAPSILAVDAFNNLIRSAICLGKLSPSYKIIPYHFIHNHYYLEPNSFERNGMSKWPKYHNDPNLGKGDYNFGSFPIVFREDWGGRDAMNTIYNRTSKIKYIMIGNYDVRCFTSKNCIQSVKWDQELFNKKNEDLRSNYLIGDDGFAYEVFHWNQTWHEYWLDKEVMLVEFLGRFNSYLPSEKAMKAFHRLLRLGLIWGYLSPDYKIVSYRQKDADQQYIGDSLDAQVRKMDRFSSEF